MPTRQRKLLYVALAFLMAILLSSWGYYACWGRYHRNFIGMTEAQVVSILGEPSLDPRKLGSPDSAVLWRFMGVFGVILKFENGKVARQWYGARG